MCLTKTCADYQLKEMLNRWLGALGNVLIGAMLKVPLGECFATLLDVMLVPVLDGWLKVWFCVLLGAGIGRLLQRWLGGMIPAYLSVAFDGYLRVVRQATQKALMNEAVDV